MSNMCSLDEIRSAMIRLTAETALVVGRLEPRDIPVSEMPALLDLFVTLERKVAAGKVLCVARAAEAEQWKRDGYASAAEWLAAQQGSGVRQAKDALNTSTRLEDLEDTADAMRDGRLSPEQADTIADAATTNPAAEQDLLDQAEHDSLKNLRDEAERRKAEVEDLEKKKRRIAKKRSCRSWVDRDGAWNLHAKGPIDAGSRFDAEFERWINEHFTHGRLTGNRQSRDNYAFDALIHLATHTADSAAPPTNDGNPTSHGSNTGTAGRNAHPTQGDTGTAGRNAHPAQGDTGTGGRNAHPTQGDTGTAGRNAHPAQGDTGSPEPGDNTATSPDTPSNAAEPGTGSHPEATPAPPNRPQRENLKHLALLRVDLLALQRGTLHPGEVCEIAGLGPVAVSTAREVLGDAILKLVITNGVDVVNVTHLGRGPTTAQTIATLWTQPTCAVEGCTRTSHLETDHRQPWADTQVTELANLDRLCAHHHTLKTHDGWALIDGTGRRPLVPPHDPRHPTHAPPNPEKPPGSTEPPGTAPGPRAAPGAKPAAPGSNPPDPRVASATQGPTRAQPTLFDAPI